MSPRSDKAGELLRARGLRSTPQRRAILAAFHGGPTEHLSADEVYARAAESVPDLSRGTVYATLAEFSELGLLSAFGAPEPVRYETNTTHHAHFRCRLCLRIFDLAQRVAEPRGDHRPRFFGRAGRHPRRRDLRRMQRLRRRSQSRSSRHLHSPDPPPTRSPRPASPPPSSTAPSERCSWPPPPKA